MQSSPRALPFKQTLAGASPATDASSNSERGTRNKYCQTDALRASSRSQGVISSARRFAKAEVRGASPRESTISNAEARMANEGRPSRAILFVIRNSSFDISLAPVPQQLQGGFRKPVFVGASPTRGSNFQSGSWCNSSISPCEGDGPGANPGFLTIFKI